MVKNPMFDYYGLTPQEERQPNIKRKFQDDPKCRFIIGTPSDGAAMALLYTGCKHRNLLF